MRRRIGLLETIRTTDTHGHSKHIVGCEYCVMSRHCTIGNPQACKTGVIRPIGDFNTNFTSVPRSKDSLYGGRRKKNGKD